MPLADLERDLGDEPKGLAALERDLGDKPSVGQAVLTGLKAAASPSGFAEQVKSNFGGAVEGFRNPSATTLTTLAAPQSLLGRVGAVAAGTMMDQPATDWWENLKTAGKGAGAALIPEILIPGGAKLFRSTEAGRQAVNRADAARVGRAMGEAAPTLQPGTTAEAMQRTAEGPGLARLGAAKEATTQAAEAAIGKGSPATYVPPGEIPMPSLAYRELVGATPPSPTRAVTQPALEGPGVTTGPTTQVRRGVYGEETVALPTASATPGRVVHQPTGEREFLSHEGTQLDAVAPIFSGKSTWSLRDANAALSEVGDMMHGRKPLDPRFKDVDLGKLYGQIVNDIKGGLAQVSGPEAAANWEAGQAAYRAGRSGVLPLLERPNLIRQGQFTAQDLQRWLKEPTNRADLAKALGGDLATGQNLGPYTRLVESITRGAQPGMVDELAGRAPGLFSGRGSYGMWRVPVEAARALFPNASSRYVGRQPYTPPSSVQTLLDLMSERGAQAATR